MRISEAEWRALMPTELQLKRKGGKAPRTPRVSKGEELFAWQCAAQGLPAPKREHAFAVSLGRKWRFDFCWPAYQLAVEIEGFLYRKAGSVTYLAGRHASREGFHEDCVKYHAAHVLGFTVERWCPQAVREGIALSATIQMLTLRGWVKP
jgi:hypothetical protein